MIYFTTPGKLDEKALKTFGLSSKDESQIGRFGTGLKYSIAIILRLGGTLKIISGDKTITFEAYDDEFRGKPYQGVNMVIGEEKIQLPFTLNLGRDWPNWTAYRELYANTLDEGGTVDFSTETIPCPENSTQFIVDCAALFKVHFEFDLYFISPDETPLAEAGRIDIYPGKTNKVYYQGIAVYTSEQTMHYRYNIKEPLILTEDRTARHSYYVTDIIRKNLTQLVDEEVAKNVFSTKADFETTLEYRVPHGKEDRVTSVLGFESKYGDAFAENIRYFCEKVRHQNLEGITIYGSGEDVQFAEEQINLANAISPLRSLNVDLSGTSFAISDNQSMKADVEVKDYKIIIIKKSIMTDARKVLTAVFNGYFGQVNPAIGPIKLMEYALVKQRNEGK